MNRRSHDSNVMWVEGHADRATCGLVRKWRNGARLQKMTTLLAENARRGPRHLRINSSPEPRRSYDLRFCHDATHREHPIAPFATNIGLQSGPLVAFSDTRAQKQRNRNARQPASKQPTNVRRPNAAKARQCMPDIQNAARRTMRLAIKMRPRHDHICQASKNKRAETAT